MLVNDVDSLDIPAYGVKSKRRPAGKRSAETLCPYNEGVACNDHVCERCGFNPKRKREVK